MMRGLTFSGLVLLAGGLVSCGDGSEKQPQPDPAAQAAEQAAAQQLAADEDEASRKLRSASKDELVAIIDGCRAAVQARAKAEYQGPYDVYLVDEYSDDRSQAAAYAADRNALDSTDERADDFFDNLKASASTPGVVTVRSLNTTYAVISIGDGFNGPVRRPAIYHCKIGPDLKPEAKKEWES